MCGLFIVSLDESFFGVYSLLGYFLSVEGRYSRRSLHVTHRIIPIFFFCFFSETICTVVITAQNIWDLFRGAFEAGRTHTHTRNYCHTALRSVNCAISEYLFCEARGICYGEQRTCSGKFVWIDFSEAFPTENDRKDSAKPRPSTSCMLTRNEAQSEI